MQYKIFIIIIFQVIDFNCKIWQKQRDLLECMNIQRPGTQVLKYSLLLGSPEIVWPSQIKPD
jgi:hypothetical protein